MNHKKYQTAIQTNSSLQISLLELLKKQTKLYTMGDSTSVPKETAQELLRSICYTLQTADSGFSDQPDVADLEALYLAGIRQIEKKIALGKKLWQAACLSAPLIDNLALRDTLHSIRNFWKQYHYAFFAHEIPCIIDYQLCHPVPESLLGVDYINEYLQHILIENELIGKFPVDLVIRLLQNHCPDYKNLLINLYEPVAGNVLGLALMQSDVRKLDITAQEREKIFLHLKGLPAHEITCKLKKAAKTACAALQILHPSSVNYLTKMAEGLSCRIQAAFIGGSLRGVFPHC